jgi:hypothetical protein
LPFLHGRGNHRAQKRQFEPDPDYPMHLAAQFGMQLILS